MATRTFIPSVPPVAPFSVSTESAVNKIEFGDGYSEDSPDGINPQRRTADLRWILKKEQVFSIYNFLRQEAGWGRIQYRLPGDTAAALWLVTNLNSTYGPGNTVTLSATFTETFL